MTSGIQSKGVDLDNIFAIYSSGTHPPATGIKVNGADIANRYQPLPGTAAPATGILTNGADLNTLFAAPTNTLPIDGQRYSAGGTSSGVAPIKPCSGTLYLQVGAGQINIQKQVVNNGGAAVITNTTYALPAGAAYLQITVTGVTQQGTASQTNLATTWIAIPGSLTTELTFVASQSGNTGTSEISGSVTLNLGSGQSTNWTGTCVFDASADISA